MYTTKIKNFMIPYGRVEDAEIEFCDSHEARAKELVDAGYGFSFEVLRTGEGSATLDDDKIEQDVGIVVMSRAEMEKWMEEHTDIATSVKSNIACLFHHLIDEVYPRWEKAGKPNAGVEWNMQQEEANND